MGIIMFKISYNVILACLNVVNVKIHKHVMNVTLLILTEKLLEIVNVL